MGNEENFNNENFDVHYFNLDRLFAHSLYIFNNATISGSTITTQKKL